MTYGAETWAVKKAQEKKLDVVKMRMLRWMSGVTKQLELGMKELGGTTKVSEITKKVQEIRLKWCGPIEKRRRICGQASDDDGGVEEKKERKTEAEVVG